MSDNKAYMVVRCPKCGYWRVCWIIKVLKYVFKCNRCNHSTKFWKKSTRGVSLDHKRVVGGREAAALCAKLNQAGKTL